MPSPAFRRRSTPLRRKRSRFQKRSRYVFIAFLMSVSLYLLLPAPRILNKNTNDNLRTAQTLVGECRQQRILQERDTAPIDPSTASVFNCHSPHGKCTYFRPYQFFHSCGKGHAFSFHMEQMFHMRRVGTLWEDMPPIVMPYLRLTPDMQIESGEHLKRMNLSMIHVHKCGGSSLVTSFQEHALLNEEDFLDDEDEPTYKGMYLPYRYWEGREGTKLNKENWRESSEFVRNAVKFQPPNAWDDSNHMMIATVRDPAERFISAVGHVTANLFQVDEGLKNECLMDTASETLRCFVDLIKENGYFIDLHFTPMVMEIGFATMGKDVPVAIFDMSDLSSIMEEIGAPDPHRKKKDGKKPGYRQEAMMGATMADYDDDVLRDLCNLYKMDVIFLRQLGRSSRCDDLVDI